MSPLWDDLKRNVKRITDTEDPEATGESEPPAVPSPQAEQAESTSAGPRMVYCVKLRRELPGLEKPPFPGELGQRIYEHVSQQAYAMWQEQAVLLINHYGLSLADPDATRFLLEQMEAFFFGDEEHLPEGWTPPGLGPQGKGGPLGPQGKGGAPFPQGKGGPPPAPQHK